MDVEIDYEKFENDKSWDGLKGYITNTKLNPKDVMENYKNLWHTEKAFRDVQNRSEGEAHLSSLEKKDRSPHLCIVCRIHNLIYKELERVLPKDKSSISLIQAAELTHTMYGVTVTLPGSQQNKKILLKPDEDQALLKKIIDENF